LSQQDDPSSGWAQHAPLFSSFVSLGVQQTAAPLLGVQQEEASTFFSTLNFLSVGILKVFVSIIF
jgi:hypothetical protein